METELAGRSTERNGDTPTETRTAPLPVQAEGIALRETLVERINDVQRLMMSHVPRAGASAWLSLELSTGQLKLLMWLVGSGAQPMSQIAHVLGIGLPAATHLVDRMLEAGLATREHSPVDRRVVLVQASEAGHELVNRLRQSSREHVRHVLEHVPDESLPALLDALAALQTAASKVASEGPLDACPLVGVSLGDGPRSTN